MIIPRVNWDNFFMLHAHLYATRSTCNRGPELLFNSDRHGVGCVLVKNHMIVAGGYNGSPPGSPHCDELKCDCGCGVVVSLEGNEEKIGQENVECEGIQRQVAGKRGAWQGGHIIVDNHCVRTLHAEINALIQCARHGISSEGCTSYTTAGPCWDCGKTLIRAGIKRVVFGAHYESRYGLSSKIKELLEDSGIEVYCLPKEKLGISD